MTDETALGRARPLPEEAFCAAGRTTLTGRFRIFQAHGGGGTGSAACPPSISNQGLEGKMTSDKPARLNPLFKMYQRRDRLTVAAALPGGEPEDVEVEVTPEGSLRLRGRMRGPIEQHDELLLDEWGEGIYERELKLPMPVDGQLANLTYSNGVLVVTFPIAANVRPAQLRMASVGSARGERIASHGNPPQATTSEEHHSRGGHPS